MSILKTIEYNYMNSTFCAFLMEKSLNMSTNEIPKRLEKKMELVSSSPLFDMYQEDISSFIEKVDQSDLVEAEKIIDNVIRMMGIPSFLVYRKENYLDYSNIESEVREEIAERIAMVGVELADMSFLIQTPREVNTLHFIRQELRRLVDELGGNPASVAM